MPKKDISKKTVAILLIIAIAFSVIGTWIVMTRSPDITSTAQQQTGFIVENQESSPESKISLVILPKLEEGG